MKIQFEGIEIEVEDKTIYDTGIEPGEMYMARRNTGWKLLTCKFVDFGANRCTTKNLYCEHHPDKGHISCVFPVELAYVYDSWESFRVKSF